MRKGGQTVYFGDVGKNAQTIIDYFETGGARKCREGENPCVFYHFLDDLIVINFFFWFRAEYMLDVIGAGATAVSDRDWHDVWLKAEEHNKLEGDLKKIHEEGKKHPPVSATVHTQFATPWAFQAWVLIKRQNLAFWRNPTYLMSKISLNIIGGLFIGFTFFKSKDTIQDNQNKLFVSRRPQFV